LKLSIHAIHLESSGDCTCCLRTKIDKLEGELRAASVEFRAQSEPVTISKVQAALPARAALVELVRVYENPAAPRPATTA
jgi:hypothetical protein